MCGPLTGGAYLAQSVADALDADFAWTEGRTLTGDVTGRRVAIVDDAINAGSAVSAAAEAITAAGGRIVAVAALLTLGAAPATIAGIPVQSLATAPVPPLAGRDLPTLRRRRPARPSRPA